MISHTALKNVKRMNTEERSRGQLEFTQVRSTMICRSTERDKLLQKMELNGKDILIKTKEKGNSS